MRWLAAAAIAAALGVSTGGATARTLAGPAFVPVATGLDRPVYVTAPAGEPGVLYVVEQGGDVRVIDHGTLQPTPFLDLHDEVTTGDEQGLLSLAFDQRYAANHFVYVDYTGLDGFIHVDRFTMSADDPLSTRRNLLHVDHSEFPNHNGGLVVAAPDRRLYVGLGDGGSGGDPHDHAQDLTSRLGKLLSLDLTRPADGWRMLALGLRNPWRYSFDRQTGDLYIGDVGQDTWEEVDVVQPGDSLLNMGWPAIEGRVPYRPATLAPLGKLVAPVLVYSHQNGNCAIVGGYVYRGAAVPAVRGKYVYGDDCSGTVWTTTVTNGKASSPATLGTKLSGLSSFGEDAAGELYATTLDGTVYRLK